MPHLPQLGGDSKERHARSNVGMGDHGAEAAAAAARAATSGGGGGGAAASTVAAPTAVLDGVIRMTSAERFNGGGGQSHGGGPPGYFEASSMGGALLAQRATSFGLARGVNQRLYGAAGRLNGAQLELLETALSLALPRGGGSAPPPPVGAGAGTDQHALPTSSSSTQEWAAGVASPAGAGGGGLEWQVGAALHELSVTLRRDVAEGGEAEAEAEHDNGDGDGDGEEGGGGGGRGRGLLRLRMQRLVLRGQRASREGARVRLSGLSLDAYDLGGAHDPASAASAIFHLVGAAGRRTHTRANLHPLHASSPYAYAAMRTPPRHARGLSGSGGGGLSGGGGGGLSGGGVARALSEVRESPPRLAASPSSRPGVERVWRTLDGFGVRPKEGGALQSLLPPSLLPPVPSLLPSPREGGALQRP